MAVDWEYLQAQEHYSPWRIVRYLRDLLFTPDRGRVMDPDRGPLGKGKLGPDQFLESQMICRADVQSALNKLPHFHRTVLKAYYTAGIGDRRDDADQHIATILRTDPESVRSARLDGVEHMSRSLGFTGDTSVWRGGRRARSPRVWRKPNPEPDEPVETADVPEFE